eukprot:6207470-Pleurochrysis_carterae.AAC.4
MCPGAHARQQGGGGAEHLGGGGCGDAGRDAARAGCEQQVRYLPKQGKRQPTFIQALVRREMQWHGTHGQASRH